MKTLLLKLMLACILLLSGYFSKLSALTFTSVQSGFFSSGSTWAGGAAPGPYDDIIISSGHTVTLDAAVTVFNITIDPDAVLDNGTFNLTIDRSTTGNPIYLNNGTHNGSGYLISYDDFKTEISGNGITNCTIIIRSYGLSLLSDCQLTINGNIQHASPGNNGMNGKILIETQLGASLTVNGDIITDPEYGGVGIENGATITVNGSVSLPGSSAAGSGGIITNFAGGTFNVSGNLSLGPFSSYCQNYGSMIIGGDLTGGYDTYFFQEVNAAVKFGGSVFPGDDGFLFAVESPINGSSQPNSIEYNGTFTQNIPLPTDMAYSNLVISNSNATATIVTDITVNGDLTIKPGSALTVGAGGSLSVGGTTTIESDATGTGSFISDGATSANVQRYIAGHNGFANDGWHLLSSPVTSQAISAFHTPGGADDFYKWDEATNTWINRTASGGGLNNGFETNFLPGIGYMTAFSINGTKTFAGSLNITNQNITGLSYTGSGSFAGWHLLGNPFSSAVNWNNGNWSLNGVDANAQIWDESNASYTVILPGEAIPSMNGFMVHANQPNASLTIPSSARLHSSAAWYKSMAQSSEKIVLTAFDYEGNTAQSTIIRFDGNATESYDNNYDSYFLEGYAPIFFSFAQSNRLALNTLPQLSSSLSVPLGFKKNSASQFVIKLQENITGQSIFLTDLITGETVNLNEMDYSFSSGTNDNENRFLLHFALLNIETAELEYDLKVWAFNKQLHFANPVHGTLAIFDTQGRRLKTYQTTSNHLQNVPFDFPSGIYIASFQGKSSIKTVKIFVQ